MKIGLRRPRQRGYDPCGMGRLGGGLGMALRYGGGVAEDFLDDRRAAVLARVRMAALLASIAIGAALLLRPLLEPAWTVGWFTGVGLQAAVCAAAFWCAGQRWAAERSDALAGGFLVALAACLPLTVAVVPAKFEILIGYLIVCVIAAALFFPWGVRPQAGLVVALLGWLLLVFPVSGVPPTRVTEGVLLYAIAGFLSVFGAFFLDRYRRVAFVEREQARLLARDRALLLDLGRELIAAPDISSLVARVVQLARPLLACDAVDLQLWDTERSVFRMEAIDRVRDEGDTPLGLEFAPLPDLLAALEEGRVVRVPGDVGVRGREPVWNAGEAGRILVAPMLREGELLGSLTFARAADGAPFSAAQRELVHGIANQTAIALANARLVEDLQKANRVKSEFVSTMSHELRTPLHVILGYTEMLDDAVATPDEVVRKVRFAATELLELIDATLDLNRLESGRDEPEFRRFRVGDLMEELEDELRALPRADGVELTWHVEAGDSILSTDRKKLKIILKNLITNALKYTGEGRVEVVAGKIVDRYEMSIQDTGEGIAADDLDRIFEMFQQVPGAVDQARGGVGLGLYIVRRLADQLGVTVDVESELGRGSRFRVRVPCAEPAQDSPPVFPRPAASSADRRVT